MVAALLDYAAQAIAYSLLAAVIVELLLFFWQVDDPSFGIAFRLPVLTIPPILPLLFDLIGPDRASPGFRENTALLDLNGWLGAEPSLAHPMWLLLFATMAATAALEAVALLRWVRSGHVPDPAQFSDFAGRLLESTSRLEARDISMPLVRLVALPGPTAYAAGLLQPAIMVSPALVNLLDDEELEGVLVHERAHVRRQDNWLGWLAFALRVLSFYNPVVQFTFHRIGHDIERVCDAESGRLTGKPLALASALIKVYMASRPAPHRAGWMRPLGKRATSLENRARQTLIQDRAERLLHPEKVGTTSYPSLRLVLLVGAVVGLAYLVV